MALESSPSTTPLTPPHHEEAWLDWLRLLRSRRVGASTFYRLMTEYGSAAKALGALPDIAAEAGVKDYAPVTRDAALLEWQAGKRAGATPLAMGSRDYPADLADVDLPPPFLWALGDTRLLHRPKIALIGARNASSLGVRMARKLARDLGEAGFVIVSGLARGVDTAAHEAALRTGTIAVFAGGVDVIYPSENTVLGQEVGETGLIVSERPMHLAPRAQDFPRRNRIISGLSKAVVVVEAAAKSGSLITARMSLDQGRDVLAVPGHPIDARAAGCNMLLRDGATLIRSAADVVEAIGPANAEDTPTAVAADPTKVTAAPRDIAALHTVILERLGPSPLPEDQLIRDLGYPAGIATREIASLELSGQVSRDAGGLLSRTA